MPRGRFQRSRPGVDEWIKNAGRIAAAAWSVAIALLLMGIGGLIWSGRISQKVDDLAGDVATTKTDISGIKNNMEKIDPKFDVMTSDLSVMKKTLRSIQGTLEREARQRNSKTRWTKHCQDNVVPTSL